MFKNQCRNIVFIVVLFLSTSIYGQRLKSIGINGGYIVPIQDVNSGFSIEARTDFGEVLKYVFFLPTIGYRQINEIKNDRDYRRTHLNFGTYFFGYINSKPRGFYGGVGIHYHIIQSEEEQQEYLSDTSSVTNKTNSKLGLSFNFGYLLKFKKISLYIEPGYTWLHGGFSTLEARLGINYML